MLNCGWNSKPSLCFLPAHYFHKTSITYHVRFYRSSFRLLSIISSTLNPSWLENVFAEINRNLFFPSYPPTLRNFPQVSIIDLIISNKTRIVRECLIDSKVWRYPIHNLNLLVINKIINWTTFRELVSHRVSIGVRVPTSCQSGDSRCAHCRQLVYPAHFSKLASVATGGINETCDLSATHDNNRKSMFLSFSFRFICPQKQYF